MVTITGLKDYFLTILEDLQLKEPKTKLAEQFFKKSGLNSALLITNDVDENTMLAIRNLKNFSFLDVTEINPYDLIKAENILVSHSSISVLKELLNVK